MSGTNDSADVTRRTVLRTIGATGTAGVLGQVAAADRDDIDREQLAKLRRATSKYQDRTKAEADGYVLADHCVAGPPEDGNMGFHATNPALLDTDLSVTEPEILVYEKKGPQYNLVGVEFASMHAPGGPAPELLGHELHPAPAELPFNWALHVWAWKNNPNGLFADWNPRVTCPD